MFQSVYQCIVKPQAVIKTNEMFLPGRMSFIFNMVRVLVALFILSLCILGQSSLFGIILGSCFKLA